MNVFEAIAEPPKKQDKVALNRPKVLLATLTTVALIVVGIAGYFYWAYANQQQKLAQTATLGNKANVLDAISKHILLPQEEKPSILTVTEKNKLDNQAFFKNAQNGDTLLVYTGAKKVILYRSSIDKVIEVAPLSMSPPASPSATQPTP